MKRAIIISGNLAQDHEFIYPYYRLLEEGFDEEQKILELEEIVEEPVVEKIQCNTHSRFKKSCPTCNEAAK